MTSDNPLTFAGDPFILIDEGEDQFGIAWEVGTRGSSLVVRLGVDEEFREVQLTYSGRGLFAEAVARAVTPGQESG